MISIKRFDSDKKKHVNQLLPQIADIEQKVQEDHAWSKQTIAQLLSKDINQLIFAKYDEGSKPVVAFCLYQIVFENAEILRMGTHPKFQRRGIAQSLLDKLFKKFQKLGVESLMLEVRANNKPAIKLYQKNGFKQIDIRKGYYKQKKGTAIDALIMQKKF